MRKTERNQDPRGPNAEERLEHEKTHLPFRSWCRHGVRGRGKEEACREGKRSHDAAEVHMDFMFIGDEGSDKTLAMLMARYGMTLSTVAPRKSSGEWLEKRVMAFMWEAGCEVEAVVMKTDDEPALVKVLEEIGRLRAAKGGRGLVVENSPVYSSKSNGYIERSVQGVQGTRRGRRDTRGVRGRWRGCLGWISGKERCGRGGHTGGPLGKLSCMWEDGIYLGVEGTTGEMIVGDKKGVWRTRAVRRKTLGERWARENLEMVGGVPRQMGEVVQEDLKLQVTVMDNDYRERMRGEAVEEAILRRMFIRKQDVEEHGYTGRCPGCVCRF